MDDSEAEAPAEQPQPQAADNIWNPDHQPMPVTGELERKAEAQRTANTDQAFEEFWKNGGDGSLDSREQARDKFDQAK